LTYAPSWVRVRVRVIGRARARVTGVGSGYTLGGAATPVQ